MPPTADPVAAGGDKQSDDGAILGLPTDLIDAGTFDQILEMDDDDEERSFSRAIVFGFFEQAETTFQQMETNIKEKNLEQLSSLGHFLKGSSATLGLITVKDACEKIQHLGSKKDETGNNDIKDEAVCVKRIEDTLTTMKKEYRKVEDCLKEFYGNDSEDSDAE